MTITPNKPNPIEEARDKASTSAKNQVAAPHLRRYRYWIFQVYLIAAIAGFAILALLARTNAYFPIDLLATRAIQTLQFEGALLPLMQFISWFGYFPEALLVVVAFALFLFIIRFNWEAACAMITAVGALTLNSLIKYIIARPRPGADLVTVFRQVEGYSFPSGHVMFYSAFFGFLAFLTYSLLKPGWLRTLLVTLFTLMVVLVGPSRVYLGGHWASDVLGGYLMGSLVLIIMIQVYRWGRNHINAGQKADQ